LYVVLASSISRDMIKFGGPGIAKKACV